MASIICSNRAWDLHKLEMRHLSDHQEDVQYLKSEILECVTEQLYELLALLGWILDATIYSASDFCWKQRPANGPSADLLRLPSSSGCWQSTPFIGSICSGSTLRIDILCRRLDPRQDYISK